MATLKISSDLQNVIKKVVLDTYFPVGSLYLTVGSENPNNTIGGTWTKLSGYYLYADTSINNTSYTGKHTQNHTLTENQIPSHKHIFWTPRYYYAERDGGDEVIGLQNGSTTYIFQRDTSWTGGGQGHSHNIATHQCYVWKRTA